MAVKRRVSSRSALSPWFIYRLVMASLNDGGAIEELEFDFNIGQGQAVEIATTELGCASLLSQVTEQAVATTSLHITLHRRTGTLSDELAPTTDSDFPQSEVLHNRQYNINTQDEAPLRGGSAISIVPDGPLVIPWTQWLGEPLLVVANLTLRADPGGAVAGSILYEGVYGKLLYRYVKPTNAQIATSFIARQ